MFFPSQVLPLRVLLIAGLIAVTSLSIQQLANAQTTASEQWTWMGGSTGNGNISGVHGDLGIPAPENTPGSRNTAASWTDKSGNFWLFGGSGTDDSGNLGRLNDMWEFNPSLGTYGEWAWMGGSSTMSSGGYGYGQPGVYGKPGTFATGNIPGGRNGAAAWADSNGNFWLFGGDGIDVNGIAGELNDLWEFNPSKNEWAWIGGTNGLCCDSDGYQNSGTYGSPGTPAAGNLPGGRMGASSWTDLSGNLWLFGGYGYDGSGNEGYLNDLWEFNPSLGAHGEWAWMAGSSSLSCYGCGQSGSYGSPGSPASGNIPGGRDDAASWTDGSGNFWLFGGSGYDASGHLGNLNDVWEFNPSLGTYGEWAWMGGKSSLTCFLQGTYPKQRLECIGSGTTGALGTPATGNIPLGRSLAAIWTDLSGNFWLFGGYGACPQFVETVGFFDDLWEFSPSTNEWAWMGGNAGSNFGGQQGVYGTLESPAAGNLPGSRQDTMTWTDNSGNFWLFGGYGDPGGTGWFSADNLNDLWVYQPPITRPTVTVTPSSSSLTAAQILQVIVAVIGEDGTPVATGSVTLSDGAYTSDVTSLTSGSAIIDVPAGELSVGNDTLTTTYTPDVTSLLVYSTAKGVASVTVAKAQQTIAFTPVAGTQYALTSLPIAATATSGLTVVLASATSAVCTVSGSTVSLLTPGVCVIHATQGGSSLYFTAPLVSLDIVVDKAQQTISFPAITATEYALGQVTLAATASSGLTVAFNSATPTVCGVTGTTASLLQQGTCIVQATQAGDSLYAAAPLVQQNIPVHLVAQTITFPAPTAEQFALTQLPLTATASSGLAVTYSSITPAVCTVSGSTASLLEQGICYLHATQPGNNVYSVAPLVVQSILVHLAPQTITFPAITATQYVLSQLTLSATASSGLTVAFASVTPAVCSVSGATASLLTTGDCVIHATQAGNATVYSLAPLVSQSFIVHINPQAISFPAITATLTAASTLPLTAMANSGLTVAFASTTPAVCTVSGTTASLLTSGVCILQATQAGNADYAAAAMVQQNLVVHLAAQTIDFPAVAAQAVGATVTLGATASSGLTVSYTSVTTPVCTVSGSTATMVSAGACVIHATQAGNATYGPAPLVSKQIIVAAATAQ